MGSNTFDKILRIVDFRGDGGLFKPFFHRFKLSKLCPKRQLPKPTRNLSTTLLFFVGKFVRIILQYPLLE